MRFDLGQATGVPRFHITSTYTGTKGTQTVERIAIGDQSWERQPGSQWAARPAQEGAVIEDNSITVEFTVTGITLVPTSVPVAEAGKRPEMNRPGEGHLHFVLDLQPLVVWERGEPYTFSNLPPGEHLLMVELVNNDHSPCRRR